MIYAPRDKISLELPSLHLLLFQRLFVQHIAFMLGVYH